MPLEIGDQKSALFEGLSGFWQVFFRDTEDLVAFYQASEIYLGQAYLDLLTQVLNTGLVDTPVFNKEYWKLFAVSENQVRFKEGVAVADDRYVYDMPGAIVTADFLQNTIFDPSIIYERNVDFEILNNDGLVRFQTDIFREYQHDDGTWSPLPGVAWRSISIQIGNKFQDQDRFTDWRGVTDVKPGDTLRLLAYCGPKRAEGVQGQVNYNIITDVLTFTLGGPETFSPLIAAGDVIKVYGTTTDPQFDGVYIVKSVVSPTEVVLEHTLHAPLATSPVGLIWQEYKEIYFKQFERDYLVSYVDTEFLVGDSGLPLPLDLNAPLIYSVVRDIADPDVHGIPLTDPLPLAAATYTGYRHLIPGTVQVYANKFGGGRVVENEDYTVDYLNGIIYPIANSFHDANHAWDATISLNRVDLQYRRELVFDANGLVLEESVGTVKQAALWVPEVLVDRFTLYHNYGSLLNRFEVSSETYKSLIRGIIHLYVMGPVFERIESALNLAAGYPVIKKDGEVLTKYVDGVDASGVLGQMTAATSQFTTSEFVFSEIDVGGQIVIDHATEDRNIGHFRILEVLGPNTVLLETVYGFADEINLEWILSRSFTRTVQTDAATYIFPFYVPMRADLSVTDNIGKLIFQAFDQLTEAFRVVDYVEDPRWWHNKVIPQVLWEMDGFLPHATTLDRRIATTQLYENIINPLDGGCIGDPGFFIGGDDEGNVVADPMTQMPYRHCTAFCLFDRYLKFHMFYVWIAPKLELSDQFKTDLDELILITKPSYTYPYVEPNEFFADGGQLYDIFQYTIHMVFPEFIMCPDTVWKIGSTMHIGDYWKFIDVFGGDTGIVPDGLVIPAPVTLPLMPGDRIVRIVLDAMRGGRQVVEGIDYTFVYDPYAPNAWTITPLTIWDGDGVTHTLANATLISLVNLSTTPIPDTRQGYTPLSIGGNEPNYVHANFPGLLPPTVPEMFEHALQLNISYDGLPFIYP